MKVAIGGTFNPIHDGHRLLLENTLRLGSSGITIGLTSDELASKTRDVPREVDEYRIRKRNLEKELEDLDNWDRSYKIRKLEDPYGIASRGYFDALVVSPETEPGGKKINKIRRENDLDPLILVVVPFVLAEDGNPISSTRVIKGEIDGKGNLL